MEISYRARPFVCGALGRWDAAALSRLVAAAPEGLTRAVRTPHAELWSTAAPERWSAAGSRGFSWAPGAAGRRPRSWPDAAERRLAAGLVLTGRDEALLHTDALGLQELYLRRIGDGLYFASRIDPLVGLDEQRLHVDWSAWANLLVTAALDDQTPFEEIRRVRPATAHAFRDGRHQPLSFTPGWLNVEPGERPDPGELVDVVAAAVPRRLLRRVSISLSGGWDSRFLAMLLKGRTRNRSRALSTSNDDGLEHDLRLSEQVAAALGLPYEAVIPGPEGWLEAHAEVRRRLEYQSWQHTWLYPLAQLTHQRDDIMLDGFGGDVLFRYKGYYADIDRDRAHGRDIMWSKVIAARFTHDGVYADGVRGAVTELSRPAFDRVAEPLLGHHAWPVFARIGFASRSVGMSPSLLFGPETDVRLPFIQPDVLTLAARLPLGARGESDDLYRTMMSLANPQVATLPSTNDPQPKVDPPIPRRQASPAALATMAQAINARDEVRPFFGWSLLRVLDDEEVRNRQGVWNPTLYPLEWGSLLAQWLDRYDSRLAPTKAPFA
ncbi:hypothetical protein GCM10009555_040280 [Acrocarpospora macrocephala]|uniref:asparagine synthase (glutamine-hydrolyzing) n=1 Tax=Acrocarpospora macrocephala TaxID=150177 RepID=A0A5M3WPA5_9ACTN|nr:asparagine synthase-related protein [Acrocarpospora macrocephala]GES09999.1 hypothetical protein Amac_035950 [Acrocarpospora macrocephala]